MHTFRYKGHYIHEVFSSQCLEALGASEPYTTVQIANNPPVPVKSVHAAKLFITRYLKKGL